MTEIRIEQALDEAQFVKVEWITGLCYVQVWHGGTQVQLVTPKTPWEDTWEELAVWNVSDDKGRPVERETIEKHMDMHFERIRESMESEDQ